MSDCCCGSTVDVAALEARQKTVLTWVLIINLVTFLMMVAGSFLSGSSALLSGTLDNLGDAATYAVSLLVVGASSLAKARVAFLKGLLILAAALAVAVQIIWRLNNMETPMVATMGIAASLNLAANGFCLYLLTPLKDQDVNMNSVWECSRNDVFEGTAVIATTAAVWLLGSGWPDVIVAIGLLVMFLRSALRVLKGAWQEMHNARPAGPAESPT